MTEKATSAVKLDRNEMKRYSKQAQNIQRQMSPQSLSNLGCSLASGRVSKSKEDVSSRHLIADLYFV